MPSFERALLKDKQSNNEMEDADANINTNKILIAGDPHGDFKAVVAAVKAQKPEAIILLGDCDLYVPLEVYLKEVQDQVEVFWIPGNHDYDLPEWFDNLFNSVYAANNLDGRVVEIAGLRVAGLGGIFKGKIWNPQANEPARWKSREDFLHYQPSNIRKSGLRRYHECAIWPEDYERLADQEADILVVHEAPSCHPHGFEEIDLLAELMGVKQIYHGHHHRYYTATLESGIKVCGAPINGVVDLDGQIVEGRKRQ